ncbi:MAG: ribonuclease D [Acidobacteria bacterium]|nr:ribonuclease D [Acidobacteriota bacterium]
MQLIENSFQLEQAQKEIEQAGTLAVDIETYGHASMNELGQVRLIQVGTDNESYIFDMLVTGFPAFLKPIFANPEIIKIFHYGVFDMSHLTHHYHAEFQNTFCTYLASRVLSTGLKIRNSLKAAARRYLNEDIDKEEQTGDWSGDITASQLSYAAKDVEILLPLYRKLSELLDGKGLRHIARLEFGIQRLQAHLLAHGLPVSRDKIENECQGIVGQFPGNFDLDELIQSGKKLPSRGLQQLVERYRLLGDLASVGFVPDFQTNWRDFGRFFQKNYESEINSLLSPPVFKLTFKGLWLAALGANARDYRSREHLENPDFLKSKEAAMLRALGEKDHRTMERYKYHIHEFREQYPGILKWQEKTGAAIVEKKPLRISNGRVIHTRMFEPHRADCFHQILDTTASDFIKTLILILFDRGIIPCQFDHSRYQLIVRGGTPETIRDAIESAAKFTFGQTLPEHLFIIKCDE